MTEHYLGIDLGAETVKIAEISGQHGTLHWTGRWFAEHCKQPADTLRGLLHEVQWERIAGAAVTGRFKRQLMLNHVPQQQAQAAGFRSLGRGESATVVSIGGHGFSVLELRPGGTEVFRENSRCSQGTGNFLRQLVQRFDLSIEDASALCDSVADPAPLSGRCPVILKTDMTHLANKGEDRARILAGLYDAVCDNVQVLIKPQVSPPRMMLIGGVSRSARIRRNFARFLAARGMELIEASEDEALFLEALGAAVVAMNTAHQPAPRLETLFAVPQPITFDTVPGLSQWLPRVRRMPGAGLPTANGRDRRLILGFDIGSTGSKLVALDTDTTELVWEGYTSTNGNPVGAAQILMQRFIDGAAARFIVVACGATGSGREIVGSVLATCYGTAGVYVLNEIAAHAEGALHYDRRVDTIFEIGGQDAKYIRLAAGRVIDAAMNEACSAGTGSFIEEQGRKFSGIDGVVQLGQEALASERGVSLGQHCSVFMAEVIDGAVAAGVESRAIVAGLYDSVVQNYLNRVKGSRSVGQVIFCQGMPFAADALAAAVARQTGSEVIVPPRPGTVGALGIALLARKALALDGAVPLEPQRFLGACVTRKDTFVCKSTQGCGGSGNRCRIDRVTTVVAATARRFTWGGACSLWDKGTGRRKLPGRAPDPFRSREELIEQIAAATAGRRGRPTIGLTDEFQLKGLFPFFATFLFELGFDLVVRRGADQAALKRGIERANVPFCAPMQQFHGVVSTMAEEHPDFLFVPMLRGLERGAAEPHATTCPIVQGSPDVLRWDLGKTATADMLTPVIDIGPGNLASQEFLTSCRRLADALGVGNGWLAAYQHAIEVQSGFADACLALGREALAYCREHDLVPIVVLGRIYTIYNKVLNSNVPAILREQGALPIPVDCYPTGDGAPVFEDMYWGYGQRSLRAAHDIRRCRGIYSIWCSNYACGPDSFNLHFYSYVMHGRPFAVIETDGHSGDAGTKTRVEAFLHCVRQDLQSEPGATPPNDFKQLECTRAEPAEIRAGHAVVLIARLGPGADVLAAALNGAGIPAEALPMPDRESVRIGRRYTSGKECVPMCITAGSLLQRLESARDSDTRFVFLMPRSTGPCRFGVYNLLHKLVLERLGWHERVGLWSPVDNNYAAGMPTGLFALAVAGWATIDVLLQGLYDVRPVEVEAGAAEKVYRRALRALLDCMRSEAARAPTLQRALTQAATGRLFGCTRILRRAAREFAAVKSARRVPTVAVVGEIYVRCDPFANDFVIDKLESRGIRARLAPFNEWLEYAEWCAGQEGRKASMGAFVTRMVLTRCQDLTHRTLARRLGWHRRMTVAQSLAASAPYLRRELHGEAVLTLGGAVHDWRGRTIDGVVNVAPLECMPAKLAETQLFHVAEREGLASVTLAFNGDPLDPEALDNFVFEVLQRFRRRHARDSEGV